MKRERLKFCLCIGVAALLAGCGGTPTRESAPAGGTASRPGYYKDDGPADSVPVDLDRVPDASPRPEPLHRFANRPYTVFGREYVPATSLRPYRERGIASWYGRKFHGQKTAIGETYDMFAMTAAHPTLPLPSFARVTNVTTGKTVIVRVNDRGPFLNARVIDLSYAAAHRLGIAQRGSGEVEVEAIIMDDMLAARAAPLPNVVAAAAPAAAAPVSSSDVPRPAAAADPVPIAPAPGGFAVQLGAFASLPNAQVFVSHLANQLTTVGVEAQVRQINGLFRVFVGPYASRDEARRVGERIRSELGMPSVIAVH